LVFAYPDRTAFLRDYFRIAGDSPGTMDCGFQALNERIGDLSLAIRNQETEIRGRKIDP
jgi:hypothetical protein